MESTDQSSTDAQPKSAPGVSYAPQPPKWKDETDEHKYARHTRNATVFIAWLLGISTAVGIVLSILAVIDLGKTSHALNPTPTATCYNPNDPSTVGLPVC